jgi:4-hydroxy-4-methyl-2-oxoglutarate aldolase
MTVRVHAVSETRIPDDLVARWRRILPAIVADLAPDLLIDPAIRPLKPAGTQPALFGRAATGRCDAPDFGAVLAAVGAIRTGDVLVIAAGGDAGTAMIGEILGGHIHARGAAGIVCDGAVRDVDTLAGLADFAVYSRSITPRGPSGAEGGEVGGAVIVGGRTIRPGDLILGDGDGLVALPPERLAELIGPAEAKLTLEAEWAARLAAGHAIGEIFGLV